MRETVVRWMLHGPGDATGEDPACAGGARQVPGCRRSRRGVTPSWREYGHAATRGAVYEIDSILEVIAAGKKALGK